MRRGSSPYILLLASFAVPAAVLTAPVLAEAPTTQRASLFDPTRHMRIDEVRPGMKGYGLSVFSGTKIERFELNVISVVKNFNAQEDVVLIRCLGDRLEHTGVIAGMSGSPIFLTDDQGRDRMIGALAYGWSLSKDPICGVQPIQYMLDLSTAPHPTPATVPANGKAQATRWSVTEAAMLPGMTAPPANYPLASWNDFSPNTAVRGRSIPRGSQLSSMTTPLMVGGLSPTALESAGPLLSAYGLTPLQAGAASAPADERHARIEPGSSLAVPLVTGDLDLTALGTCTETRGNRVYGFGHPFQNEGPVNLPMASGFVSTIIPSLSVSFKLGGMGQILGTLSTDQSVGIAGELGAAPPMIPVDIQIVYADGTSDRSYKYQIAAHPQFTPMLGTIVLLSSLTGPRHLPQYHTLDLDLNLQFSNGKSLHVANTAVNSSPADLFFEVGTPLIAASENPFQRVMPTKISGTMRVTNEARAAEILDVNVPRTRYLPGETVKAFVTFRPFRGPETVMPVEMQIPADLPDGSYSMTFSDWQTYLSAEQASEPFRFTTENVDQVFDVLKEMSGIRRNALYVRLQRQSDGVAVGRTAMPRLPSSRRQVLLGAGRSNTTAFVSSSVKTIPSTYVFSGEAEFDIEVDRKARADRPHKRDDAKVKPLPKPATNPAN